MDKNQSTGFILIGVMLLTYLWFFGDNTPQEKNLETPTVSAQVDSLKNTNNDKKTVAERFIDSLPDSVKQQRFGIFANAMSGTSEKVSLENENIKITFDTYGASFSEIVMKKYVSSTKETLILLESSRSKMNRKLQTVFSEINLDHLYYQASKPTPNTIVFRSKTSPTSYIEHKYVLGNDYSVAYSMKTEGMDSLLDSSLPLNFEWSNKMKLVEKVLDQSRMKSTINYYTVEGDFDYLSETSTDREEEAIVPPVRWLAMKQKFFNSGIVTKTSFASVNIATEVDKEDKTTVKAAEIKMQIPLADLQAENISFYFGPNDYDICSEVSESYERNVYLGWGFFATINKWLIIPLFQVLENSFVNYGIIILILVFIVKTVLLPLQYKSYTSMAKMKVLQPEMEALKKKHKGDQTKVQADTMKLNAEFGVSPVAGCIPMLAQMPITLAMFNFFPNAIELRQKAFLWADDLSSYDSVYNFGFDIPMYGDHISLFTILMTVTTLVSTYFNNQMSTTTAQTGPMKNMGYIMPLFFMFFLNNFSSGLTYYYFISTLITIIQMVVIKKYFIDEVKIRAKLEERKSSGKVKGGLQQRLANAMKTAQETKAAQDVKTKTAKNTIKKKTTKKRK